MNETQGMEDVTIIQVDSNSLSYYLNVIMNADDRGTLVQLYKAIDWKQSIGPFGQSIGD